jgi:hypothetical protein
MAFVLLSPRRRPGPNLDASEKENWGPAPAYPTPGQALRRDDTYLDYIDSEYNSRPISMRRISLVPAPIS